MPQPLPVKLPLHYGWIIMVTGTICIFACLGLGRFSLGMLLPSMGQSLKLTYSQMGLISTANFIGYLAAVLISSKIMQRIGARNLISCGLVLVGASMISISATATLPGIMFFYIVTGVGSGMANVPIMALIALWFSRQKRGRAAGFVVIGSGLAIILSGKLIPYLNGLETDGWRTSWLCLGSIVLFCAIICYTLLRNSPSDHDLEPIGAVTEDSAIGGAAKITGPTLHSKRVWHISLIYFLFGFSYVIYVTFIVTSLVQDRGFVESVAGTFWAWVGGLSLLSGPLLGSVSDKFGRKVALIAVFSIQAAAYLFVALPLPQLFLFLSIGCYGIVAWSIPSIITALVADYAHQQRVAAIFGFVTFIFGFGQISGPYLGGLVADKSGSFSASFLLAFGMAVLAICLSAALPGKNR